MRKTYFLILSLFICFLISCDGRDRSSKPNIEVLKENKLLDSFSENITYSPTREVKTVTDTILSNNFNVKIKTNFGVNRGIMTVSRKLIGFNLMPTINNKT